MRFSAIATLAAAPLALANSLQSDLSARGLVDRQVDVTVEQGDASTLSSLASQGISVASGSATEIILIWVNNGGGAPTQTINAMSSVAGASASAATHNVTVGGSAGLVYSPDSVVANIGDMVIFNFESQNHTVTQAAFAQPCVKIANGMDSGFMPNPNNSVSPPPAMAMQVTVATPLWFYCRQNGHCGKGMTFSINPNNATTGGNKTQAAFQQLAIAQNGTGSATAITGGSSNSGSSSVVAAPPVATTASAAAAGATMASGTGSVNNGACECSCLCGQAAFPQASVQGIGMFGGMSGAMPMAALEST